MEAVLVVQPVEEEPSIIFSACADGHVLRWELDADLNADSYKSVPSCDLQLQHSCFYAAHLNANPYKSACPLVPCILLLWWFWCLMLCTTALYLLLSLHLNIGSCTLTSVPTPTKVFCVLVP